jgi:hypothetical protein
MIITKSDEVVHGSVIDAGGVVIENGYWSGVRIMLLLVV